MESAAQARFAREHRLPFMVVRAVLDSASTELPENMMQTFHANGKIRVRSFLSRIAVRPAQWLAFIKLAIQFRAARKTLRRSSRHVLDASQAYLNGIFSRPHHCVARINPAFSSSPRQYRSADSQVMARKNSYR